MRPAASSHVSEAERQGIIALVHDLPAVWHAKTTTHAERKHVVRLLIKDVMLTKLAQTVRVDVRWQPTCSTLEVPRPKPAYVGRRTAPEVIERSSSCPGIIPIAGLPRVSITKAIAVGRAVRLGPARSMAAVCLWD